MVDKSDNKKVFDFLDLKEDKGVRTELKNGNRFSLH